MTSRMGIIVATNGMLSRMAERSADAHRMTSIMSMTSPPVTLMMAWPSISMTPVCSMPPTTMKSPKKKPMVPHSMPSMATSRSRPEMRVMMAAAVRAMTEVSMWMTPCSMKASATMTIMTTLLMNSGLSLIISSASSAMTSSLFSSSTLILRPKMK